MKDLIGGDGGQFGKSVAMLACNIKAYRQMMKSRKLTWNAGCRDFCGSVALSGRRLKDNLKTRVENLRSRSCASPKSIAAYPHRLNRTSVADDASTDSFGDGNCADSDEIFLSQKHELAAQEVEFVGSAKCGMKSGDSHPRFVCSEVTKGRRKDYLEPTDKTCDHFVTEEDVESNVQKAKAIMAGYLLPQGYPESVAPQYSGYMTWRGVQYFFGGAISVFTTRLFCS